MQKRIFSFGGGVQSTAVMVLAAQGKVKYDAFVFANVGADSENPATLEYIKNYTKPFAQEHGLNFVEVSRVRRGEPLTLLEFAMEENRTIPLPVYLETGAPANRQCTIDFKIRVIDRWAKKQGVTRLVMGLGISTDEIHRARTTEWEMDKTTNIMKKKEYPLIDLMLSRDDCHTLIREAGLPLAPKSSCWFCPFQKPSAWTEMRQDNPDMFDKAVALENRLNEKREYLGRDRVYLHSRKTPLELAVGMQENMFSEFDNCESGYCFT
jgi:hypothetical protein